MAIPKQLTAAASQVEETSRRIGLARMKRMHAEALAARVALEISLDGGPRLRQPAPNNMTQQDSHDAPRFVISTH
jgi:hypothetical protein